MSSTLYQLSYFTKRNLGLTLRNLTPGQEPKGSLTAGQPAHLTEAQEPLTALKMPDLRLGSLTKEGILCFLKIAERNIL